MMNKIADWTVHALRYQRVAYLSQHLISYQFDTSYRKESVVNKCAGDENSLVPQSNGCEKKSNKKKSDFWISQDIGERILPRIVPCASDPFQMRCAMRIVE